MAANFPKLPGYVPTHDPAKVAHHRVSHMKQAELQNAKNETVPYYALPRPPKANFAPDKTHDSKSFSQTVLKNHFGDG